MPRRTRKYIIACELATQFNITRLDNQNVLYRELNEHNYYWDSNQQNWILNDTEANPPTEIINVRVWADTTKVEGAAYQIRCQMEEIGYKFLEGSEPYKCRPPKQLESRIYLKFL